MPLSPTKNHLLRNVDALMVHHWGKVNKSKLRELAHVGQGTYDRIADGTSIGLDTLEAIAAVFKVEPWQLLMEEFNPASPPRIQSEWPFKLVDQQRYEALSDLAKGAAQMRMMDEVTAQEGKFLRNGTSGP
jgi:hypothetical protein